MFLKCALAWMPIGQSLVMNEEILCGVIWDSFVRLEKVNKVLGNQNGITHGFDPCLSWLFDGV